MSIPYIDSSPLWVYCDPVTFYNRKGRRVCANHVHSGDT
jgi:hypothetical protein